MSLNETGLDNLVHKALEIATKVHKDQKDKKNYPYMAHVQDIRERVKEFGEVYEIVAILHDAIEDAVDTSQNFQRKIREEIKTTFTKEVFEAVDAMTRRGPPLYTKTEDYKNEYLPRLKQNQIALKVKIADSSHNLSKAHLIDDVITQSQLRDKYINVLNYLGVDGKSCEKPLYFIDGKWQEKNTED